MTFVQKTCTVNAAILAIAVALTSSVAAQQLPPGISLDRLTPQQRAELLRLLTQYEMESSRIESDQTGIQLPSNLIPQPDTTRGITRVDTTQFYSTNLYDFGAVEGEPDSLQVFELFGRRIFQLEPETFEPSILGPVGPDYRLGPGDQVIITMWGAYQQIHDVTLSREGYVLIPEVGQIVLANLTLEESKRRLLQMMTPYYQALNYGRNGATAQLDLTLGKLRAIKVFVLGDAQRPGAYTLSSISTAFSALYSASGPSNTGSLRDIKVLRNAREIASLDGYDYLLRGDKSNDIRLHDGDIVFIPPIGPKIAVQGRVLRPAIYELKSGETISDALNFSGGPSASALLERAQIARILPPDQRNTTPWVRVVIDVNLNNAINNINEGIPLFDGDVITVLPIPSDRRNYVVVEGAVWNPGRLEHMEDMCLSDAIRQAGGLREEALMSRVEVFRTNPDETTTQISVELAKAINKDPQADITLEQRDRILVYSIHDIFPRQQVTIHGQVKRPGQYLLHKNMTVMDLIAGAGGLTKDAWTIWAEVARMELAVDGSLTYFKTHRVTIDTTYAPDGPGSFDLKDFDQVFIRQKPNWEVERTVSLQGEIVFPGLYPLRTGDETLQELISRAGGLTPRAYPEGARFYRQFEEAGRINTDLKRALENPNSLNNLIMQPGDSLYVPPRVEFVTVRGAVGYPTSVLYIPGKSPRYYIAQAGGYAEQGDGKRTRVTLPNGTIWQPRWFILRDPEVEPGSTIFVPVKVQPDRNTWETIRDTAALLSSLTTVLLLLWQINR